jgi:hypothetical protein
MVDFLPAFNVNSTFIINGAIRCPRYFHDTLHDTNYDASGGRRQATQSSSLHLRLSGQSKKKLEMNWKRDQDEIGVATKTTKRNGGSDAHEARKCVRLDGRAGLALLSYARNTTTIRY